MGSSLCPPPYMLGLQILELEERSVHAHAQEPPSYMGIVDESQACKSEQGVVLQGNHTSEQGVALCEIPSKKRARTPPSGRVLQEGAEPMSPRIRDALERVSRGLAGLLQNEVQIHPIVILVFNVHLLWYQISDLVSLSGKFSISITWTCLRSFIEQAVCCAYT